MQEIELRFLIPPARLKGLMRQAKVKSSDVIQLAAHYYDTPDEQLADAGIGLRIRQENDAWVQTIKAGGDGIAMRLEHNAVLDNEQVQAMLDNDTLMPDLTIYEGTSIEPALADFKLKKLSKNLSRQYVTDIKRTTRLIVADGDNKNSIETAYDYGEIIHGSDNSQRQAIQEIEFELVSGDLDFLFATAKTWCKRYKLYLSTVTKAERGSLLTRNQAFSPAVKADLKQLNVSSDSSLPAFIRALVHNCLLQILPNSSAIVEGGAKGNRNSYDHTHTLQLRIGIRRLHAALEAFGHFSEQLNPEWRPILEQTATLLEDYRKLDYLAHYIEPKLAQYKGAPSVDWTKDINKIKITPTDAVRANDFQLTLLELIGFAMSDPSTEPQADKLAVKKLAKPLSKQHAKWLKAEQNFERVFTDTDTNSDDKLDDDKLEKVQRKLRYHLDSLRYISEFAAPLYADKNKKKTKRWLKRLKKAQKALEQGLDNHHYQQFYQQKAKTDSNALYGAGWLAALSVTDKKRCKKHLAKFQDTATFW